MDPEDNGGPIYIDPQIGNIENLPYLEVNLIQNFFNLNIKIDMKLT